MFAVQKKLSCFKSFKVFNLFLMLLLIRNVCGFCVGVETRICLTELTEEEANEKLQYILSKYEEVELKITGKPIGVNGKRFVYANSMEEVNIGFRYMDNTEYDIIQYCVFVLLTKPDQCESINTICNGFLSRTPRPLLELEPLTICEDGVARQSAQTDNPTETIEPKEQTEVEQ